MPESTLELEEFLGTYTVLLTSMRTLARVGTVAAGAVRDALIERPFALPAVLQDVHGSSSVASDLRRLKRRLKEVNAAPATIDASVEALIRSVMDARSRDGGVMRGGGHVDIGAPIDDHTMSRGDPREGPPIATRAGASRPPGQRAKPPDRGAPSEAAAPTEEASSSDEAAPRWISAEIDEHERDEPLAAGETYTIAFGVDVERRENAVGDTTLDEATVFPEGVDDVELTVELSGDDFEIEVQKQTFKLTRTGKSKTRARFTITPKQEGRRTLTATIHKDRNFVQQMTITLSVGAANAEPPTTTSISRSRSSVTSIQSRSVMIVLTPAIPSGYDLIARDAQGIKTAHLEVEPDELSSAITAARDALLAVVQHADANGADVFQTQIDIAAPDTEAALRIMARAGSRLFQVLFDHEGGSTDASNVGAWLAGLNAEGGEPLSIQIMSKRAPIPWGLLYTGDASARATLDWRNFLGIRHVIEQLPIVDKLGQGGAGIASDKPGLEVSINLNRRIDVEMRAGYVKEQEKFWTDAIAAHPRLRVTPRTQSAELLSALAGETTTDQILYFYGHAESSALGANGGSDASTLSLTDGKITLGQLKTDAPSRTKLLGNPLVFINACESAELSPLFYDGFVPYFMHKGARGVIGTECRTPGIFAAEWAKRFFVRFLAGEPLGSLVLALRQEFLATGNPLGLLYAVHCDGDTQIQPAL